jgi:hypothetical protein
MRYFYHSGAKGDIVYSLPTVKAMGGGGFLLRYTRKNRAVIPLLKSLPYITEVVYEDPISLIPQGELCALGDFWWKGKFYHNLDQYRIVDKIRRNKLKTYHLVQSHLDIYNVHFDYSKPWLTNVEPKMIAPIVVNRSRRYHDAEEIDWNLLRPYKDRIIWFGNQAEWKKFKEITGMELEWHHMNSLLETARIIKGSKIFIGNQSLSFALAEAMKVPRVLEICYKRDNCRPSGKDGYTFLTEELIEKYLNA